jgi:hypothetical protein
VYNIPLRPEGVEVYRRRLQKPHDDGKWEKLYSRSRPFVESVSVHNESGQKIKLAFCQDPSDAEYDTLHPASYTTIEANPKEIYSKVTTTPALPADYPWVVTTIAYYTEDQIKRTTTWWSDFLRGIFSFLKPDIIPDLLKPRPPKNKEIVINPFAETEEKEKEKKKGFFLPNPLDFLFPGGDK